MSHASRLAVELTKGDDHLDIWVDANNNGVRDDDDVNIYVTAGGGFYTTSPTFKQALDAVLQARIKELGVAMLTQQAADLAETQEVLCELALELVVKAQTAETAAHAIAFAPDASAMADASLPAEPSIIPTIPRVTFGQAAAAVADDWTVWTPDESVGH